MSRIRRLESSIHQGLHQMADDPDGVGMEDDPDGVGMAVDSEGVVVTQNHGSQPTSSFRTECNGTL